ncbi:MAG: ABC transporter substrate-binding protein [Deltaproteobacteria bacterium]|nr:ABC transporter substrate-binding protein [Deltaproteobacteria bacterium]
MFKKIGITLLGILGIPLVFFGCFEKKLTPLDTLVIGLSLEPLQLDPRFGIDATAQRLSQLMFDSLVVLDTHLKIVPHLAKTWKVKDDRIYTFFLQEGLTFQDGTPVESKHLVKTLEQILDPAFGSPLNASFKNVIRVSVVTPKILEIELKEPQASFLTDLTLIKALPDQAFSDVEGYKQTLIGSGPYHYIGRKNNTLLFERFEKHFTYHPKLRRLEFKIIKDDATRALKLKKGELDLIQNDLSADFVMNLMKEGQVVITKSPGITYAYLGLNLKDPVLKNLKVRQAIAYAIDRHTIIQHLLHDLATPANSILSSLNWSYEPKAEIYNHDLEKAKALLSKSGLPLPIQLVYKTSTDAQAVNIARVISDQLKKVGILVEIQANEWGTFYRDVNQGEAQLFSLRWIGVTDPDIFHAAFHSSQFPPGRNRVFYSDPLMDRWLEQGQKTLDLQKRKATYDKVQKKISQELPYIDLWHFNNVGVYTPRLRGFYFHPQANFLPIVDMWKEG